MRTTSNDRRGITRRDTMLSGIGGASLVALGAGAAVPAAITTASVAVTTDGAQAQQGAAPAAPASVTQPATGRMPPSRPGRGACVILALRLIMFTIGQPQT